MGAAAQFDGIGRVAGQAATQGQDADLVAVFLAEQGDGAGLDGVLRAHQLRLGGQVLADDRVHLGLDPGQFVLGQGGVVAEVEAHALGIDQLALLGDVGAQHILQRRMDQVGGGVVGAGGQAGVRGGAQLGAGADGERARGDLDRMGMEVAGRLLDIEDAGAAPRPFDLAAIARLAAAFAIEGGLVEQDLGGFAGLDAVGGGAVLQDRQHLARAVDGVVAGEDGRSQTVLQRQPFAGRGGLARALPVGLATALLLFHRRVEGVGIDGEAAAARLVLGQVQREAIGVIEGKGGAAGDDAAFGQVRRGVLEQAHAAPEGGAEADFLLLQRVLDRGLGAGQFGIGLAHFADQRRDQTMHQRIGGPQQVGVTHGAAHDAAQDIAAPLVRRRDPVGDQEGGRAQVVGDDAVAGGAVTLGLRRGGVLRGGDQGLEQVGVEHRVLALQYAGHPLQPHAGVDAGLGKGTDDLVVLLLELHEDVVPDLDIAVAVLVRRSGRATRDVVAVVPEDLGAGTAGTRVAHGPEVVRAGDADDPVVGKAGDLLPDRGGLIVVDVDGDQQAFRVEAVSLSDQFPRLFDGVSLEIVAEGEIPQHLEEGQVARRIADVVQVVVLAAGADAFLRGGRARPGRGRRAGEIVLERHHARIDEHQRRIVLRHQRGGVDPGVSVGREEVEEGRTDLFQAGHGDSVFRRAANGKGPHIGFLGRWHHLWAIKPRP